MQFKPLVEKEAGQPIIIAGPCSAETEEQVMETAHQLKDQTGIKVTTYVEKTQHFFEALKHNFDLLWIGARTTVSPFAVQEIADAIEGVDIPVLIKNPINPDLNLWIGAIERIYNAGIQRVGVIHRGFSLAGNSSYRNEPLWQIPIELKRRFPDLTIICDNSHICGRRDTLADVAQKSFDLSFNGLMTETHPTPDEAWSDAKQQITPAVFRELVNNLVIKSPQLDGDDLVSIEALRTEIDGIDNELLNMLGKRMEIAEAIGLYKKAKNISILQPVRWNEILEKGIVKGEEKGLSEEFIAQFLKAIHQESINHQMEITKPEIVKK